MAIGDWDGPLDVDVSQVTAQTLVKQTDAIVKTHQVTAQVLAEQDGDTYVKASQVTAQSLVKQEDTDVTVYQVTAQILVSVTQVSDPTAPYDIRRSTVN